MFIKTVFYCWHIGILLNFVYYNTGTIFKGLEVPGEARPLWGKDKSLLRDGAALSELMSAPEWGWVGNHQ